MEMEKNIRNIMKIPGQAKLETQLKICRTITYIKVEGSLARSSAPNLDHFMEAVEEECLLSEIEGGEFVHLRSRLKW